MAKKKSKKIAKKTKPSKQAKPAKQTKTLKRQPVLSKTQLEKFKKTVKVMRDDLLEIIERKKHKELSEVEVGDEIDTASQSLEKEMLFDITNSEKEKLDSIEGALRKIENSTFGICESCGKKITNKRLHVVPWARYCILCQKKYEKPE